MADLTSIRIVYMGTPEFAVAPLKALLDAGAHVVGVLTAPDRPAGRGKKMRPSAVKTYALEQDIPVLQPEKLRNPDFLKELEALKPDLQVVVAFRMLPELVWRMAPMGTFNLHASLLPQYRGAAPINHVLIQGEERTGATTFLIDDKIDTGNILLQESLPIGPSETAGELHDRLMDLGASLVVRTALELARGSLQAQAQEHFIEEGEALKPAPKIHRDDCRIDWHKTGREIVNLIRGLSPYPAAFSTLHLGESSDGKPVRSLHFKMFAASHEPASHELPAGAVRLDGHGSMRVAVSDGMVRVESLQQEGKRRMQVEEFLRGFNPPSGPSYFS